MLAVSDKPGSRRAGGLPSLSGLTQRSPVRHVKTSPEVIRLAVLPYASSPLALRNV
jgi:hypothetical protein